MLSKVKELGNVSKSDVVRGCGYVSTKKDGSERLNFTAFYNALLEAKGISVGAEGKSAGSRGRKLSYATKVQFNGNLLIGKAYTAILGLEPGDEFEIKLGRKQIKLIPLGSADEEPETTDSETEETVAQFCVPSFAVSNTDDEDEDLKYEEEDEELTADVA